MMFRVISPIMEENLNEKRQKRFLLFLFLIVIQLKTIGDLQFSPNTHSYKPFLDVLNFYVTIKCIFFFFLCG